MWKLAFICCLLAAFQQNALAADDLPILSTKSFQMHFLHEMIHNVDDSAQRYLNDFLKSLQTTMSREENSTKYTREFREAQEATKWEHKVLFIKQIVDLRDTNHEQAEYFYVLRNVNFLRRFKHKLRMLQEESAEEVHHLRIYQLCKQFHDEGATTFPPGIEAPYSLTTKLAPITERAPVNEDGELQNHTVIVNLPDFGRNLYESINGSGADIIDDYLSTIRKLLHEVIDEKPDHDPQEILKLKKIILEIDKILEIPDLYEKRNSVYAYLQSNLTNDYEQFKSTQEARIYLEDILLKLKLKGLDLFFAFLFSNFEFLERLHEEWSNLLPTREPHHKHDEDTKLLYEVLELYDNFKKDPERYEDYVNQVRNLYSKTVDLEDEGKIFELLHNAVLNVGSITLNMIRAKCDEV